MKNIFNPGVSSNSIHIALLLLRVGIGSLMLVHGVPKMGGLFSGGDIQFPSIFGLGATLSLCLAVFAEVICSIFLIVGLGTRLAAVPLIITMLVAVFYIHGNDPFIKQEMGIHYLLAYVLLLITGPGKFSLDQWWFNRKRITFTAPFQALPE